MNRAAPLAAWGLLASLSACGHSEPFATAPLEGSGPFSHSIPIRLTYSPGWDMQPVEAVGGGFVAYVFDRRTPDRDRCIGILPPEGGTRVGSLCAFEFGEDSSADQLARPAIRADGVVAFTRHFGRISSLAAESAAVYLAHIDSLPRARKVLGLQQPPAGLDSAWADLLDPVWLDDAQLLVVGARRQLFVPGCPKPTSECPLDPERFAGPDTLTLGVHLARLRVDGPAPQITLIADATDAIAMAHDATTGDAILAIQRAAPGDPWHEPVADTIVRIAVGGGPRTIVYGWPRAGGLFREHLHGVAAGGGRIYASRSYRNSASAAVQSDIFEVMPDGTLRSIAMAPVWRWGAIRLAADGRSLLAESIEKGTSNIYRVELTP